MADTINLQKQISGYFNPTPTDKIIIVDSVESDGSISSLLAVDKSVVYSSEGLKAQIKVEGSTTATISPAASNSYNDGTNTYFNVVPGSTYTITTSGTDVNIYVGQYKQYIIS